ncbi:ABC transporter permease [Paractinoplanes ferrugineus]|uniref:Membrane protein n=1 Tax=Paractinoplanes ferrugineus TaxID=113564 RepID=A0A919J5V5_9ACTN|nr:FtsX-like permease family protein [Actinoplanes ferrugineus]GIE13573.1 membrane protein [Actinoplanes ferrugineus]
MRTELALGFRLAFAGGRHGAVRIAMVASAVAIGTAALLLAASVPTMLDARQSRSEARGDNTAGEDRPAGRTVVVAAVEAGWHGDDIRGRLLWPDAPGAPRPPGVPAFPGDHQMYASPALQAALAGPDGGTLRRQMPYRVVGTIGPDGLSGPRELAYYAGYPRVRDRLGQGSWRVDRFGYPAVEEIGDGPYILSVTVLVTLLLPIVILLGAALRFGTDRRDRRLAAIRLIGADHRAVLRIALGESLVATGFGLAGGVALYLSARERAAAFDLLGFSVYPADVRPVPVLALATVVGVLALSAAMAVLGFRGVSIEPLGVFRQAAHWRGRLWWRLILPVAGVALLYPAILGLPDVPEDRTGLGVLLLLVSLIPILPYLVPAVARLLPHGPASWQLASEQLRRNPAGSTRAVTGIVVAVAGAIALQTFFAAAANRAVDSDDPGGPAFLVQFTGRQTPAAMRHRSALFEQVGGVTAGTVAQYVVYDPGNPVPEFVIVGDCAALSQVAALSRCADGDAFTTGGPRRSVTLDAGGSDPAPGARIAVPHDARRAALIGPYLANAGPSVLLTPAAATAVPPDVDPEFVDTGIFTSKEPAAVAGQLRGVAAEIDPLALFTSLAPETDFYAPLGSALTVGLALLLLMMAVGLLLDVAARLGERRRVLGVLAAIGARRSTVVWSVLLQAIAPVLSGLALASGVGAGLGALLMRMSAVPVRFDAPAILGPAAAGAGLALATTVVVLLPAAGWVTRTDKLRYE